MGELQISLILFIKQVLINMYLIRNLANLSNCVCVHVHACVHECVSVFASVHVCYCVCVSVWV
jgi:hypothetical protein